MDCEHEWKQLIHTVEDGIEQMECGVIFYCKYCLEIRRLEPSKIWTSDELE